MWGVHHDGGVQFVEQGVIALGWQETGDLSGLPDNRQPFRDVVVTVWPQKKPGTQASWAGQLYRLVHEMKAGDVVVYRSKQGTKDIAIGIVTGPYVYAGAGEAYPHRRPVEWKCTEVPATTFSQGALYELGSALSLFRVKNHAGEFEAVLTGASPPTPEVDDPTLPVGQLPAEDEPDAERITDFTRDYIVKRFDAELKGHAFAQFVAAVLEAVGYVTQISPPGTDGGVDIVASRDPLGLEPPLIKVQVKSSSGKTGAPDVQALLGTLGTGERGLFVAAGGFTPQAVTVGRTNPALRLLDADGLIELVLENYERLDETTRAALPLRRVWVPDRADG